MASSKPRAVQAQLAHWSLASSGLLRLQPFQEKPLAIFPSALPREARSCCQPLRFAFQVSQWKGLGKVITMLRAELRPLFDQPTSMPSGGKPTYMRSPRCLLSLFLLQ